MVLSGILAYTVFCNVNAMDDIFLKIIAGEIPAEKIYEDDNTLSIMDIKPNNKGHALVIPKKKYRNILDIDPDAFAAMAKTATRVARAIHKATNADGMTIVMNNEPAAGQEIFHAHLHIIPRFEGDKAFIPAKHVTYEDGEMAGLAEKIRANIN